MKQLIFEVTDKNSGHVYSIYDDGSIDGFPDNCTIVNYHSMIVDQLRAKCSIASALPIDSNSSSADGRSAIT